MTSAMEIVLDKLERRELAFMLHAWIKRAHEDCKTDEELILIKHDSFAVRISLVQKKVPAF